MSENQNVEYKKSWQDEYLKTVCAFANTDGGVMYIGIDDKGTVTGLDNKTSKKLLEEIPSKLKDNLRMSASVLSEVREGKNIIEIRITRREDAISYNGRYYIRVGSSTRVLEGNDLMNFLMKKQNKTWDRYIEESASFEKDINQNTITNFKEISSKTNIKNETNQNIFRKLYLIDDNNKFTRASILLFGNDTQKYYPSAYIKIALFKSSTDIALSDEVRGNLFEQIKTTEQILETKYLSKTPKFDETSFKREDFLEYPRFALREAIINAIIHRDYMDTSNIDIRIYKDKLIISNACRLDFPVSKLKENHESRPRNVLLAEAFGNAGYIEKWGRGTLKIIEECKANGLPEPDFIEESNIIQVVLYKDKYSIEYLKDAGLDDNQIKAVMYVKKSGEITNEIYQKLTGLSKRSATGHLKFIEGNGIFIKIGTTGKGTKYILAKGQ